MDARSDSAPVDASLAGVRRPDAARSARNRRRFAAAMLALACLALLGTSAFLRPDALGHSTHTQLGLQPCAWPRLFGRPCLTCGMTTACAHAADAQLARSLRAQPAAFITIVLVSAVLWIAGYIACTGSAAHRLFAGLLRPKLAIAAAVVPALGWAYTLTTWPSPDVVRTATALGTSASVPAMDEPSREPPGTTATNRPVGPASINAAPSPAPGAPQP